MAEALLGGALVGAFFNVLLDKLASKYVLDFFSRFRLDKSLIESLEGKLNTVEALLEDAENKEITNSAVKRWLVKLKNVCHDVEDILDQIAADELHLSIQQQQRKSSWANSIVDYVSRPLNCIGGCTSFSHHPFQSKLKAIIRSLGEMVEQSKPLGLTATCAADLRSRGAHTSQVPQDRLTTSWVDESKIYGREQEKERIIEMLISREEAVASGSKAVRVVAIVGMGGIGKTTLAQLAYNDVE